MSKTICLLAALSVMLAAGDDDKPPKQHISILEVINVKGTCYEDQRAAAG